MKLKVQQWKYTDISTLLNLFSGQTQLGLIVLKSSSKSQGEFVDRIFLFKWGVFRVCFENGNYSCIIALLLLQPWKLVDGLKQYMYTPITYESVTLCTRSTISYLCFGTYAYQTWGAAGLHEYMQSLHYLGNLWNTFWQG